MDVVTSKTSIPATVMGPNYSYVFHFEREFEHEEAKEWFLVSFLKDYLLKWLHDIFRKSMNKLVNFKTTVLKLYFPAVMDEKAWNLSEYYIYSFNSTI